MPPTPQLVALDELRLVNLAHLLSADLERGELCLEFSGRTDTIFLPDPDGKLFARLRAMAWPQERSA